VKLSGQEIEKTWARHHYLKEQKVCTFICDLLIMYETPNALLKPTCLHTWMATCNSSRRGRWPSHSHFFRTEAQWNCCSAFLLRSIMWSLHKLVSGWAAGFVSADNNYGLGCPEQEWASSLEKNQQWNSTFSPSLVTSKSAKEKGSRIKARESRMRWESPRQVSSDIPAKSFTMHLNF
jgi:hypothetical protein